MTDTDRSRAPRGTLVEGVRLIFVALGGTAGFQVVNRMDTSASTGKILLFVFIGAGVGYVLGGIMGRLTAKTVSSTERELHRATPAELAAGTAGLIAGLVIAALVTIPLFRLPAGAAWPATAFVYITLSALGYRIGKSKRDGLLGLFGLKPRAAGAVRSEVSVIDTSALIDGRVADLVSTGFLTGSLLIHSGVLQELQSIADSSDLKRRTRGRRGLDVLAELRKAPAVEVVLVEEAGVSDVDAALVRLARERHGTLVTVDVNLAKVAEAVSVPVRQIHALASAFRVPFAPGHEMSVHVVKEGREHGQGVGYLEDGTMVVVDAGSEHVGSDVAIRVTNVIQTSTGRMVFAALAEPHGA